MGKVLVAYDGSAEAKRALESAAELTGAMELTVFSVVRAASPARGRGLDPTSKVGDRRTALDQATAWLKERGLEGEAVEAIGQHPADSIVAAAEQGDFDLVVMGSGGLDAANHWMIGSTSAGVVARAHCNVLVVR